MNVGLGLSSEPSRTLGLEFQRKTSGQGCAGLGSLGEILEEGAFTSPSLP